MIKKSNNKANSGFSLIEVLIGSFIVFATTAVVLSMIISSFRISSKTTTDSVIRQNGNYALTQISKMLQFADTFESITCGGNTFDNCSITRSSCSRVDFVYKNTPANVACAGGEVRVNGATSIDSDKVEVVSGSCNFTCTQNPETGPVIGISFTLTSGGSGTVVEKRSEMDFSTSVRMRNLR